MPERRTVQIKAPIAVNSKAIAKIGNAELAHFNKQMLIHELIRGSLVIGQKFAGGCHVLFTPPEQGPFTTPQLLPEHTAAYTRQ